MKKRRLNALAFGLIVALLSVPVLIPAQDKTADDSGSRTGRSVSGSTLVSRSRSRKTAATSEIEQDVSEALSIIEDNYVGGKKLDYNNVFKSSMIGMLRTLDPHSNYFDREEFDELKTDQRSEYFGIGASIQNESYTGGTDTYVTATFEGSPAAKAGLRYGDRIVAVDGVDMRGKNSADVRDKIRGPRGSVVKVTVETAADNSSRTVELTRDVVPQPSIPDAYMIRPGVGYIDMSRGFNFTTADELQNALQFLHSQGMVSLVLDLRNNPGGFLDQAIKVSEMFLKQGQMILSQKGKNGYDKNYKSSNASPDTTPLVVLVNGNTASASEIVSGAMQDHDRALIVGQTTFGKGLVQGIFQLEYGSGLTLTTAKYYTPSGRLIQRDYSHASFYDYYTKGGLSRDDADAAAPAPPAGPETHTDAGRAVFGGGGITPDEKVKPRLISQAQARLLNPAFFFVREVANGRLGGLSGFQVPGGINFSHRVSPKDFVISDQVFQSFKQFALKDSSWKIPAQLIDKNRDFINTQLRFEFAMAAFGRVTADQVLILDDPQVDRAVESVPKATELAQAFKDRRQP